MIELKEFDITKIKEKPSVNILIIGKRNTGKSTLIKDILAHLQSVIPMIIAMSGTEGVQGFYRQMLPEIFIYDGVHVNKLTDILDRQQRFIKNIKKDKKGYIGTNPNIGIILDDCISNTDWMKEESTVKFVTEGRHINITMITAAQEVKKLSPGLRSNADYVFIFKTGSFIERKKIREEFLAMFENKSDFEYVMNKYTENFQCIVLDNVTQSNDRREQVYCYKADINARPKVCDPMYYELNDLLLNRMYQESKKQDEEKKLL